MNLPERELIDPLMWDLIVHLYKAGFETGACCQGRRTLEEFKKKKHCPQAYISFIKPLPVEVIQQARKIELIPYGITKPDENESCIESISVWTATAPGKIGVAGYRKSWFQEKHHVECWKYEAKLKVISANETFIDKIRSIM